MKKILVVDDDEDILEIVKYILISHGFDVYTHSTSFNVSEVVMYYHPNLILLDISLRGKSGTQICKELKQINTIPIILVSAYADQAEALAECHADAFIEKPFGINSLVNAINLQLN